MKTEQMLEQILNEMKNLNQRVGGVDQRVGGMDQRIEGMDQRIEGMDQRIGGLDQRIDRMDQRIGGLDQRIDSMDQRIKSMGDEIHILKNDVTNIKESMATKADIGRLEKSLEKTHMESISSDEMILHAVREVKESIQHVNRRVADTELELHVIKSVKQ